VTIVTEVTHGLGWFWQHLHDASVSALAAAVVTLGVVLLMELRAVMRLRHVVDRNLARLFEQLDLLRFETRQLLEGQQLIEARGPAGVATAPAASVPVAPGPPPSAAAIPVVPAAVLVPSPTRAPAPLPAAMSTPAPGSAVTLPGGNTYQNAAALAVGGASSREIAERLGLASGEARLLSSLALARARRVEAASA